MCHSNIPVPGRPHPEASVSSKPPPPNSIRALLSKSRRNQLSSAHMRHTYTTRYGTQENIYEEIGNDGRIRMVTGQSMVSLNHNMVEEELRRVQSRHKRVLGELNLSVEAMLMPSLSSSDSSTEEKAAIISNQSNQCRQFSKPLKSFGSTDELLSPLGSHLVSCGDHDSGFSGSSSGASYIGALRNHKTNSQKNTRLSHSVDICNDRSSCTNHGTSCPQISERLHDDPGLSSIYFVKSVSRSNQQRATDKLSATNQLKSQKTSFWRKGWRKFPGFSSTTSIDKAGTGISILILICYIVHNKLFFKQSNA